MIYLITAICMGLVIPFLSYLNRQARHGQVSDNKQLKMPKAYLVMGYLMIIISLGILIIPRILKNTPEYYHPLVWILIIALFLFGIYLIQLYKIHRITKNENGFTIYSTFGKETELRYGDIKSANISFITYFITLKDKNGKKGKVYFHLKGLLVLLRETSAKSGIDIIVVERVMKI